MKFFSGIAFILALTPVSFAGGMEPISQSDIVDCFLKDSVFASSLLDQLAKKQSNTAHGEFPEPLDYTNTLKEKSIDLTIFFNTKAYDIYERASTEEKKALADFCAFRKDNSMKLVKRLERALVEEVTRSD